MTRPEPSFPTSPADLDIFQLPGIRQYLEAWTDIAPVNSKFLALAKSEMYRELAVCVRLGIPLPDALQALGQSVGSVPRKLWIPAPGPATWWARRLESIGDLRSLGSGIWRFLTLLLFLPGIFLPDTPRIIRRLARPIAKRVAGGTSLSEAIRAQGADYELHEIAILRSGEDAGRLAEALGALAEEQLARFQAYGRASAALYGPFIIGLGSTILAFLLATVIPKVIDILSQLGATQPPAAVLLYSTISRAPVFAAIAFVMLGWFLFRFASLFLAGNRVGAAWLGLLAMPVLVGFASARGLRLLGRELERLYTGSFGANDTDFLVAVGTAILVLLSIACGPLVLGLLEWAVRYLESMCAGVFARIPFIGDAERARGEAAWLGSVALSVGAGLPMVEALRAGARVMTGRLSRGANKVADKVAEGSTLESACLASRFPSRRAAYRLGLFERHGDLARQMHVLAEDLIDEAYHRSTRRNDMVQVAGILLAGGVVFVYLAAVYTSLNSVPIALLASSAAN